MIKDITWQQSMAGRERWKIKVKRRVRAKPIVSSRAHS
jgi:hypothetical protein